MVLSAEWFIVIKAWWDRWCSYTARNADDAEAMTAGDAAEAPSSDEEAPMAKVEKRALRPIAISNRELLDADSCEWRQLSAGAQVRVAPAERVERRRPGHRAVRGVHQKAIRLRALRFSLGGQEGQEGQEARRR